MIGRTIHLKDETLDKALRRFKRDIGNKIQGDVSRRLKRWQTGRRPIRKRKEDEEENG